MYEDIYDKLKRGNRILFSRDSVCLQPLLRMIREQKHRTLVLWAMECIQEPLAIIEQVNPAEKRPRIAYQLCREWAQGKVKMPVAKRAILDCHAVCKELDDLYYISLCHAIGQGLATVHVETHAIGLAIYELSGIVFQNPDNFEPLLEEKIRYYEERLSYYQNHIEEIEFDWAPFLHNDTISNKEKLLYEKRKQEEIMYKSDINLNLYKTFYEVAIYGSITEAAKKTYTSQPAISKAIKKLEEELDTTLFYRSQSGIVLTPQGEELFYYIKKAYHNLIIAERNLRESEDLVRGKLSIGVPSQVGTFYIFEDIAKFHELYPNIEITIISKATDQLLALLESHEIDFMIDTSPVYTTRADMVVEPLTVVSNCFVGKKDSQYRINDIKSLDDLKNMPLILPIPGTSNRQELDHVFEEHQVEINNVFNIHTSEMIIGAIKRDLGIGYIIEDLVKDDIKNAEFVKIEIAEPLPTITINLVYIKNYVTTAPQFFIDYYINMK